MGSPERSADPVGANLDRARVYRALARLFAVPDRASLHALRTEDLPELRAALGRLAAAPGLARAAADVAQCLGEADPDRLRNAYQGTFEASGGLRCSPNEASHTAQTPQEALTRTFEIADVAGFYRAFGVTVAPETERPDHITAELEFMHLLALKEAVAREQEGDGEHARVCQEAARAFLRDHLDRWAERLEQRLAETAADPLYAAAGRLLGGFVAHDATRLGAR